MALALACLWHSQKALGGRYYRLESAAQRVLKDAPLFQGRDGSSTTLKSDLCREETGRAANVEPSPILFPSAGEVMSSGLHSNRYIRSSSFFAREAQTWHFPSNTCNKGTSRYQRQHRAIGLSVIEEG